MSKFDNQTNRKRFSKSFRAKTDSPKKRVDSARPRFAQGASAQWNKKFNPSDFIKKVEVLAPSPVYVSKHTFADFVLEEQLKKNIIKRGYAAPTPIQDQVIPMALEGKDILGAANTGTGKTAAFLIPLVNNLLKERTKRVLIIAPTRELAAQISSELNFFKEGTGFSSALCIGGVNISPQIHKLKKHPEFVIGTPGRLKDLVLNSGVLALSTFTAVVLDEVDTMLDMGFVNDMKYLLGKLPSTVHTLFFSATVSPAIRTIADQFLKNPVSVDVKTRPSAENVNQDVVRTNNKIETLHDLLIKPEFTKVIVFSRTKRATDKLSKSLAERGFKTMAIHGNKSQAQRKNALQAFKDNKVNILLATDIVARGIDIDSVSHVINYDMPQTHEDYIHRIGRTGRANKIGQALTFVDN